MKFDFDRFKDILSKIENEVGSKIDGGKLDYIKDFINKDNFISDGITKVKEISMEELSDKFGSVYAKRMKSLNNLNIIVAGKTGVGKSTLINSVFRGNLAPTGTGRPVTQETKIYTREDVPLTIYDTKGFELAKDAQEEVKEDILKLISDGNKNNNIDEMIHCLWYCINNASSRVEDAEVELLKQLTSEDKVKQVPVIVVLTQAFSKEKAQEMRKYILSKNLNVLEVIPVLAQDYEIDEEYTKKAYGLSELIQTMCEVLPAKLQETIQNVQIASIELKKVYANKFVLATALLALVEGFIPLPFADSLALVPTQTAMLTSITVAFGLDIDKGTLATALSSVLGTGGATITGKAIAKQLTKLLLGGNIVGGVVSGTTAGLITLALGQAYILLLEAVCRGELDSSEIGTAKGKEMLMNLFKARLDANKNISKKDILTGKVNSDF